MSFLRDKILPRHWVFLGLFVSIGIAMGAGIRVDSPVTPETQRMYDYIENLPEGSILVVSFDHEASSLPEIRPISLVLLRHAFAKKHRLVGIALLAEGTAIGYRMMEETAREYDRDYGTDYMFLGFKPQYIAAILSMAESVEATFPEDYLGRPYRDLPLGRSLSNYDDIAAVISIADGSLTTHWMEYGAARHELTVAAGLTAAMATTYDPYLASGQMHAMVAGLRGAAEYEGLLGRTDGAGVRGMLAQTTAHLYVIAMVAAGNIVYFVSRRKKGRG